MKDDDINKKIDLGLKKKKLQEKFGMTFSGTREDLSHEMEEEWLNYIEKFEEQWEKHETISVWEYIRKPICKSVSELSEKEIPTELDALLELMQNNGVSLSALGEVEDKELYRFITEELFPYEMDNMRVAGMQSCFTYEDFHPNATLDIEHAFEYLLTSTFRKSSNVSGTGYDLLYIDTDNYLDSDNNRIEKETIEKQITDFLNSFDYFKIVSNEITSITINEQKTDAELLFQIHYKGCFDNNPESIDYKGLGTLKLKPSEYGGWSIYHINMPGLR